MQDKITVDLFRPYLPSVKHWINTLIIESSPGRIPLTSLNFKRLAKYYSAATLEHVRIVIVDAIPQIPLRQMGLFQFAHFENLDAIGVTYLNNIFIRADHRTDEALLFHELIHILQWKAFGYDDFLLAYALGLIKHQDDYRSMPFEAMAYAHETLFRHSEIPFSVETALVPQIHRMRQEFKEAVG